MEQKLLNLIPKNFLCPYCGKWHKWDKLYALRPNGQKNPYTTLRCSEVSPIYKKGEYSIYFDRDYFHFFMAVICERERQTIEGKILISSIKVSESDPIVTFSADYTIKNLGERFKCVNCDFKSHCIFANLGDERNKHNLMLGFEFRQSDFEKFAEVVTVVPKEKAMPKDHQAKDVKKQVSQQRQVKKNKEDTSMAKNIFDMDMEYGLNQDDNIASTLMGVAVRNGTHWRIYDKNKKQIIDVGDIPLGNLPIFILPTIKLSEGDLIKNEDEYCFVTKVANSKTPAQTLSVRTGEMKSVIPIKNILGVSCYSKVITLTESLNVGEEFDIETLAMLSAMYGQNDEESNPMNQLMQTMLLKGKLGEEDDEMMKLVLMSSMMYPEGGSSQMNQLMQLMLLKDKLGQEEDMMKLMLMYSMMNGNKENSNNPLMSYLMLETIMDKKTTPK